MRFILAILAAGWVFISGLRAEAQLGPAFDPEFLPKDEPAERKLNAQTRDRLAAWSPDLVEEAGALLAGPHSLELKAFDAATGAAIPNFIVQAHAFMLIPESRLPEEERETPDEDDAAAPRPPRREGIGRLETRRVGPGSETCIYERLGETEFEFQVWADGYSPEKFLIRVPAPGGWQAMELDPFRTVRGRLVRSQDGAGVAEFEAVAYQLGQPAERVHANVSKLVKSDAEGNFRIEQLAPGQYAFALPELNRAFDERLSRARYAVSERRKHSAPPASDAELEQMAEDELAARAFYPPDSRLIDLRDELTADLGVIALEPLPALEVEIVDETGAPRPRFPFEIATPQSFITRTQTDSGGTRRIALFGHRRGEPLVVCAPGRLRETFWLQVPPEIPPPLPRADSMPMPDEATAPDGWNSSGADASRLHPAAQFISPRPGEVAQVRLVYWGDQNLLSLDLRARDAVTREPIADFAVLAGAHVSISRQAMLRGVPGAGDYLRRSPDSHFVQSAGALGEARLVMPISQSLLDAERNRKESLAKLDRRSTPAPPDLYENRSGRSATCIPLCVWAPGYANRAFELPLEMAREGKPLYLDLEPEARVRGRVLFAPTGEPVTPEAMERAMRALGRWDGALEKQSNPKGVHASEPPSANISNPGLEALRAYPDDFRPYTWALGSEAAPDGTFEIGGLKPGKGWALTVQAHAFGGWPPPAVRRDLELRPGMNNLGDIFVGPPGRILGRVTDDTGSPIENCMFHFPLQDRGWGELGASDSDGNFSLDAGRLLAGDEQLLRIVVPHGGASEYFEAGDFEQENVRRAWFEKVAVFNRTRETRLDPVLPRGHELRVELPPGEGRTRLAETHAGGKNQPESFAGDQDLELCLYSAAIAALEPDAQGFFYHQWNAKLPRTSLETKKSVGLVLEGVPPGKFALRLDAAFLARKGEPPSITRFPIAYAEFVMPAADHELRVDLSRTLVEFRVVSPDDQPLAAKSESPPLLFMDRLEPLSRSFGNQLGRIGLDKRARDYYDPARFLTPMASWWRSGGVTARSNEGNAWDASELVIAAVPPGRYAVRLFSLRAPIQEAREAAYDLEFEVEPEADRLGFELIWRGPKPLQLYLPLLN